MNSYLPKPPRVSLGVNQAPRWTGRAFLRWIHRCVRSMRTVFRGHERRYARGVNAKNRLPEQTPAAVGPVPRRRSNAAPPSPPAAFIHSWRFVVPHGSSSHAKTAALGTIRPIQSKHQGETQ